MNATIQPTMGGPAVRSGPSILIVGASGRAAAMSCVRAGLQPHVWDFFADIDTQKIAATKKINKYQQIIDSDDLPPCEYVMFTGAMEYHPKVVRDLAIRYKQLGNPTPESFDAADSLKLFLWSRAEDIAMPTTEPAPPDRPGNWLVKPLHGAGGVGISHYSGECHRPSDLRDVCYQQLVPGTAMSAVVSAGGDSCELLGVTRQLVGLAQFGAKGFAYCGSIGPIQLSNSAQTQLLSIAEKLTERFKLAGIYGIDFVLDKEKVWLIEVNPRYTASTELIELHWNQPVLNTRETQSSRMRFESGKSTKCSFTAKAILFWNRSNSITWNQSFPLTHLVDIFLNDSCSQIIERELVVADIPQHGTVIRPGNPILTLYARGNSMDECMEKLAQKSTTVWDLITRQADQSG
jgi:uncharacterized protein